MTPPSLFAVIISNIVGNPALSRHVCIKCLQNRQGKLLDRMLQYLQALKIYKFCVKRCFKSTFKHVSVYKIICEVNYQILFLNTDILDNTFTFVDIISNIVGNPALSRHVCIKCLQNRQRKLLDRMLQYLQALKIYKFCVKRCFKSTFKHVSVYKIICEVNYQILFLNTDILDNTFTFVDIISNIVGNPALSRHVCIKCI